MLMMQQHEIPLMHSAGFAAFSGLIFVYMFGDLRRGESVGFVLRSISGCHLLFCGGLICYKSVSIVVNVNYTRGIQNNYFRLQIENYGFRQIQNYLILKFTSYL